MSSALTPAQLTAVRLDVLSGPYATACAPHVAGVVVETSVTPLGLPLSPEAAAALDGVVVASDGAVAAVLNDPAGGDTHTPPVPLHEFAEFLMGTGLLDAVEAGQRATVPDGSPPEAVGLARVVRAICKGMILKFQGAADRFVYPTDPATQDMMAALVAGGVVTTDDVAAFAARSCSRAVALVGRTLAAQDVASALGRA